MLTLTRQNPWWKTRTVPLPILFEQVFVRFIGGVIHGATFRVWTKCTAVTGKWSKRQHVGSHVRWLQPRQAWVQIASSSAKHQDSKCTPYTNRNPMMLTLTRQNSWWKPPPYPPYARSPIPVVAKGCWLLREKSTVPPLCPPPSASVRSD